jgi:LAO/AO transport system kinase
MHRLVQGILTGDRRALARAMTLVESRSAERRQILQEIHPHTGRAYRVGITGPPGAGKSSLTDRLIGLLRKQGKHVGVIAVDPTSPFTGGAILGDRIRMNDHALDPGVFIRSMGSRGTPGGLSGATKEVVRLLDAYGSDVILMETVGVGQTELDVMHVADTVVVVLHPGTGDHIQARKAGIMEIADVFVVNKADLPGADKMVQEINHALDMASPGEWRPPVVATSSSRNEGVDALWDALVEHRGFLERSGLGKVRRRRWYQDEIVAIAEEQFQQMVRDQIQAMADWDRWLEQVEAGLKDPYEVASALLQALMADQAGPGRLKKDATGNE